MSPVTGDNCPWCFFPSQPKERICRKCGHFAHVNQLFCECAACMAGRPKPAPFVFPISEDDEEPVAVDA